MKSAIKKNLKRALQKPVLYAAHRVLRPEEQLATICEESGKCYTDRVLRCCISYNTHGAYCVPLSGRHLPAARAILGGKIYEPATIELIARSCGDGDIVHAGTFFGDFLPALSNACRPTAKVWCFEPNPESYRCAQITSALNGLTNVCIRSSGLAPRNGVRRLKVRNASGVSLGGCSSFIKETDEHNSVEAEIVSVDQVIADDRQVSVLQLDVEGFEQAALEGAAQTLSRCKPLLILETAPSPDWERQYLLPLGYRKVSRVHTNDVYAAR